MASKQTKKELTVKDISELLGYVPLSIYNKGNCLVIGYGESLENYYNKVVIRLFTDGSYVCAEIK